MNVLEFTIPVARNQSIIVQEDMMPHFYPYLHRHSEAQLMWILQGEGTLVAGTGIHPFKANDIFFLGANQPHLFKSNPEYFVPAYSKQIHCVMIFFNPYGNLAPMFQLPEMLNLANFIRQHGGGFKLPTNDSDAVIKAMLAVKNASDAERVHQFIALLCALYQLNNKLTSLSSTNLISVSENEGIRISNIYSFVMQNLDKAISLDVIAKRSNLTPPAFCRYFKKHTGTTFITFLNRLRVNEACKKLTANKGDNISTVAYSSGFNSITHFNRIFKEVIGHSPREYLGYHQNRFNNQ